MSSGQLRLIFGINEKILNDILADLCEKQRKIKNRLSLDFYDIKNLIIEDNKRKEILSSMKIISIILIGKHNQILWKKMKLI